MSRHLFSASAAARVEACPGSLYLQAVSRTSEDAERGNGGHKFLELVADGIPKHLALEAIAPEYRDECAAIDLDATFSGLVSLRPEVAYAIDVRDGSVRLLGSRLARAYVCGEYEVPGTVDLVATDVMSDVPVAVDWKTGFADVPHPSVNLQVGFAAYCVAAESGAGEVEGRIAYHRGGGVPRVERHRFDSWELDGFLERLQRIHAAALEARGRQTTLRPGEHCRYCPALASCDAQTGLARDMLPVLAETQRRLTMLTPEQAGEAWQKLRAIKQLADHVEEGLKAMARQQPLPLPNGQVLKETRSHAVSFNKSTALALLRERGVTDAEIAALTTRVETRPVKAVSGKRK